LKDYKQIKDSKEKENFTAEIDLCPRIEQEEKCCLKDAITSISDQEPFKILNNKQESSQSSQTNKISQENIQQTQKLKESIDNILSSYNDLITKVEKVMKKEKFMKLEEMVK
jgi:mevalonate kinase